MLKIGVIGYGGRIRKMMERGEVFEIPFRVSAIADPRAEEIKEYDDPWLEGCAYFKDADDMIANADDMDGIMIGTLCNLHTEMSCKAAARQVPLFLEKPLAITFEQLKQLVDTFENFKPPVVVSFPLRVTRHAEKVKQLLEQDTIGRVDHVVVFNDVPYGGGYFNGRFRDFEISGGLWTQKATHDFDCINYFVDKAPTGIFAMEAQRIYGGDKPHNLRCRDCDESETCPESIFNQFYKAMKYPRPSGRSDLCVFSREVKNHDCANAIVEYEDGLQVSYTQNFFARHKAAARGAKLHGHKGTIHLDWYTNSIKVYSHVTPTATTIEYPYFPHHWGGDKELWYDWVMAMRDGHPSRCPMSTGITSVLMCLWARESAGKKQFCELKMP